jgi:UDP-N-acetyl-D-mannosaminuronic acid dehydrogenase
MKVSVLGLGYIGLPTALLLAEAGNNVIGIDINEKIIEKLSNGELPFDEPGLDELYGKAKNNFSAKMQLESSDFYIISVPTPLEKEMKMADLTMVKNASETISKVLQVGQTIILESTVPPGTSKNFVLPILQKNGVQSFYFAHCPERAIPGKTLHEMIFNSRIIGGICKKSTEKAKELYSSFVKGDIYITDNKTAEFVKLIENTSRDINIAIANEFALISEEIEVDVWEAITLANKHPRVNILKPGPGVGGHCIAIDPLFIVEKSSRSRLVSLAREINEFMPIHVIKLVKEIVKGINIPTITLLGLAYKGNVNDTRESPAFKIKKIAENEGIIVKIYDPYIDEYPENSPDIKDAAFDSDCLVLITDHDVFKDIDPNSLSMRNKNLIDTRNILPHKKWIDAGYTIRVLGNGNIS